MTGGACSYRPIAPLLQKNPWSKTVEAQALLMIHIAQAYTYLIAWHIVPRIVKQFSLILQNAIKKIQDYFSFLPLQQAYTLHDFSISCARAIGLHADQVRSSLPIFTVFLYYTAHFLYVCFLSMSKKYILFSVIFSLALQRLKMKRYR